MAENSSIEWTDNTFNPWRGCTKVSPGCTNCYAADMARRFPDVLGVWGDDGTRVFADKKKWAEPLRWERKAVEDGKRRIIFCASIADVWEDRPELVEPRGRLFRMIRETPHLDWLILTKRPENISRLWPVGIPGPDASDWPNIWLGATAEDRKRLVERSAHLRAVPAAVRFLSCEPLLEDIAPGMASHLDGIHWAIVGGESGPKARSSHVEWIRGVVAECREAGAAGFVKQFGRKPIAEGLGLRLRQRKGNDPEEWPADLRIREYPEVSRELANA